MYSIGIDTGSAAKKSFLFNGEVLEYVIIPTGPSPKGLEKIIYPF